MVEDHILSARILMVDDEESNLELLRRILEPVGFKDLRDTSDPFQVLPLCRQSPPDLVLLDIAMPGKNGFEVLAEIRQDMGEEEYLPVLVLTSDHSPDTKRQSLSAGAQDFLTKPLSPAEVRLRVRNLLQTRFLHLALRDHNRHLEERVRERTAELEEAHAQILARLARAAEYRDDETGEHTRRVGRLSGAIAQELGLDPEEVSLIHQVAPLHDLGKIGIPDDILLFPGPLTTEQEQVMRSHTEIGGDLMSGSGIFLLDLAEQIARTHHERWDGSGYPLGLSREEIPIAGRIVAVADSFDAVTHRRPYKPAWPAEEGWKEIAGKGGTDFDPAVLEAFTNVLRSTGLNVGDQS
ncbi:MAG: response regulator [Gemmatimonadetes bacterium]|nr:response regulator [Gemmatimonadota bacterium]NNM04279.1 response regulator [Gemmatimonadota bacterium]